METNKKKFDVNNDLFVYETKKDAAIAIGLKIVDQLEFNSKQTLGLTAGESVNHIYETILEQTSNLNLSLENCKAFLTAEFLNISDNKNTLMHSVYERFLKHTRIATHHIFVPTFLDLKNCQCLKPDEFHNELIESGPIDLQLMWVGENGQLAFNEPSDDLDAINKPTSVVNLSKFSQENIKRYFQNQSMIPTQAMSMGLLEIIYAKTIFIPIYGQSKLKALTKLFTATDFDPNWPITALLYATGDVKIFTDFETKKLLIQELKNKNQ